MSETTTIDSNIDRNRLDFCAWEDRQELIVSRDPRRYAYAIAPFGNQFLIHPKLNDETVLLVVWEGMKMDFADGDILQWPEWAAEAVAAYVKWKILIEIEKRPELAAQWYLPAAGGRPASGIYAMLRLSLYREQQEALAANHRDQEYAITLTPQAQVVNGFGAQEIPFLSTVRLLTGTGQTALAAVPTTGLAAPFAVEIDRGTGAETWILKAGTDATDETAGILRPNDYHATTNAKVWLKQ